MHGKRKGTVMQSERSPWHDALGTRIKEKVIYVRTVPIEETTL